MIQYYAPEISTSPLLPENESGHCCRVLRRRAGDIIRVVDGRGGVYECEIIDPHPRHTMLRIISEAHELKSWSYSLTIAISPTKSVDRMEWLLEKLVEIGVDRVELLLTDRSERKALKKERMERIMVSAMNQSLKSRLPELGEMRSFDDFLENLPEGHRYLCYCDETIGRHDFVRLYSQERGDAVVLIGPEGDFSPREVDNALKSGFRAVTLGEERLRTETAALYAATATHVVSVLNDPAD